MYTLEEKNDKTLIVKPEFNIEMEQIEIVSEMKDKILKWIDSKDEPVVILNLEDCEYIDSTGLGNLIRIYEHIRRKKGSFLACNINNNIKSLFDITTINNLISCYDTLNEALQAI